MIFSTLLITDIIFFTCTSGRTQKPLKILKLLEATSVFSCFQLQKPYKCHLNTQTSQTHKLHVWVKSAALDGHCNFSTFHFLTVSQNVETSCQCPYSVMLICCYRSEKLSRQNAAILHRVVFRVSSCGVDGTVLSLVSVSCTLT